MVAVFIFNSGNCFVNKQVRPLALVSAAMPIRQKCESYLVYGPGNGKLPNGKGWEDCDPLYQRGCQLWGSALGEACNLAFAQNLEK